jgi:hypothetical protein
LNVSIGTFQGSILGPLLFNIYINNIFKLPLKGRLQAYADDLALVYSESSLDQIRTSIIVDLETIDDFLRSHKLSINLSKTKYILFHGSTSLEYFTQHGLSIVFQNNTIERVSTFLFLGQIIDEKLNFKPHIEYISSKITPMIYAIKRIRHFVDKKILYSLYYSYIHCHLLYMNPLWSNTSKEYLNRLFILQKKILKIIENKPHLTPSYTLFSENMLPLPVLMDFNLLILAFKIKYGLVKNNVAVHYVRDIHRYDTRQRGDFYVYSVETKYGHADFYRRGLIKFNELPSSIKSFRSLSVFKNRLKEHLFSYYRVEASMGRSG